VGSLWFDPLLGLTKNKAVTLQWCEVANFAQRKKLKM